MTSSTAPVAEVPPPAMAKTPLPAPRLRLTGTRTTLPAKAFWWATVSDGHAACLKCHEHAEQCDGLSAQVASFPLQSFEVNAASMRARSRRVGRREVTVWLQRGDDAFRRQSAV